ncbi:hypothetical protein PF011_g26454 [Phytophthora fragariae]|uniref:Myb-like domain-containing protein n=1 Tax=Phytophthora fragariae TaxID=53985 RepID=A0A6A3HRN2_9STRA|nr:hypothetical protein PF011_g26454 [Phytophthora fragariae]
MDSSPARAETPDDINSTVLLTPKVSTGKLKRKTTRLVWTDELHLKFVSAVFELGVKNASPKALLALMETKNHTEGLTVEHIKSHLQKYRISYERSRLEVQRLNDKHAKRSLKRHHHQHSTLQHKEATTTLSQDTNQQWDTCDALIPVLEAPEQHMHWTMQQRMDFHRELLLTRSVELTSGSSWASRMDNTYGSGIKNNRTASDSGNCCEQYESDSSFLQAWVSAEQLQQQEAQVYGRLKQQQQILFLQHQPQDATPIVPVSVQVAAQPPQRTVDGPESIGTADSVDLASWGRFSLTVDSGDDDIFGFLRS